MRVVVRCRPTPRSADDAFSIDGRSRSITVTVPRDPRHGHVNNLSDSWAFKFPAVLVNASQQQVFDECVRDLAAEVLAGYNGSRECMRCASARCELTAAIHPRSHCACLRANRVWKDAHHGAAGSLCALGCPT